MGGSRTDELEGSRGGAQPTSHRVVHGATLVASVAFHAGATLAVGVWLLVRLLSAQGAPAVLIPGDGAPAAPRGRSRSSCPSRGTACCPRTGPSIRWASRRDLGGGAAQAHLDTGTAGRGGDDHAERALNLADRDERMRLSPDLLSRLDRDQLQRLRVARVRQSWEDRRATTHPMELTILVTGHGTRLERRAPSPWEPSRGALRSPSASAQGGEVGTGVHDEPGDDNPDRGGRAHRLAARASRRGRG